MGGWALGLVTAALLLVLLRLAFIDLREQRLPNTYSYPLIAAGLLIAAAGGPVPLHDSALGGALGYLVLFLVNLFYRGLRGRDGIGGGDAKLLAAGGAWTGWAMLPFILLVAAGSALLVVLLRAAIARRPIDAAARVPFGPFVAAGFLAAWMSLAI